MHSTRPQFSWTLINMIGATVAAFVVLSTVAFGIDLSRTFETMVACRDGVELHTRVVMPKDYEGKKFTTIIDRSPYGYKDLEWIPDLFVPAGFVTVGQDMRGTEKSGGNFTIWHSDADDSEDLGNWIIKQPWSNGEIFSFGASADGLAAFTTNFNQPKWLKAQYYVWTSSIGYEVIYPNGALLFNLVDRWIRGTVREDDLEESLSTIYANEMKTSWWDALDMTNHYGEYVPAASGFWAGWYDIFLVGTLAAYNGYNYEAKPSVRYQSMITIDPCGHCQDAANYFTEDILFGRTLLGLMQAFQVYGVRPVERTSIKNVTFYVMSSNDEAGRGAGQFWTSIEAFPKTMPTQYYLHGDRTLSTSAPAKDEDASVVPQSTSYKHDPANPVPSNGGSNLFLDCGPLDQQDIDRRSDVVSFQTPVMSEELPLTGALNAHLYVSSDAIDTDFMVRISDVYPTGEARLLQDSAVRMRWRHGDLTPQYLVPGGIYPAYVSLWNTSYVVAPGHALRVAISSSNYPRFSVNANNGLLLSDAAYPGANITATNTIHHSHEYPSSIELPVVRKAQLPKVHNLEAEFAKAYPTVDMAYLRGHGEEIVAYLSNSRKHGSKGL